MIGIMRKTVLILAAVLGLTGLYGCGKGKQEDVYDTVISSLTQEQSYAYVEIGEDALPLLLVADGTYDYGEGIQAAIACNVYYAWDGKVQDLGEIASDGTAYPISFDQDGIYTAGGHYVARYLPDAQNKKLAVVEFASEVFDEDGNASYTSSNQEGEEQTDGDSSVLDALFEKFGNAKAVDFGK